MPAQFNVGQEIIIKQSREKGLSVREAALSPYSGMTGKITNSYWIRPPTGKVFYLYTVQVSDSSKEIVLYEDEIAHLYQAGQRYGKVKGK
jgi:hypothetical protein